MLTGLRDSELRNLRWKDVDLDEQMLVVRCGKGRKDRVVPLCKRVCETLRKVSRDIRDSHVFVNPETGEQYKRCFNNTSWKKALRDSDITHFRFHDLRHTFASRLAQRGVSILIIKELMGHSSITVTMRYAHLAPNDARDAVKVLDIVDPRAKKQTKKSG